MSEVKMTADAKVARPAPSANPLLQLEFFDRAKEFRDAYKALPSVRPPDWPRYFMLCHAIELALNAFLVQHGYTQNQLRGKSFGHDLEALIDEVVKLGLKFSSASTRSNLGLLAEAHAKYWPRYPKNISGPVFVIDNFESDADDLLNAVKTALGLP